MGALSGLLVGLLALGGFPVPPDGIWHGAYAGDLTGPEPLAAVRSYEALTGKGLAIVHSFVSLDEGFPRAACDAVWRHGSLPMVSVSPGRQDLASLARGDGDAAMRRFASDAARWGRPFLLRWAWEMNGRSIPWSGDRNGGPGLGPARYVSVWRRFHDLARTAGMRQARWVWCVDAWGLGPGVGWNHWRAYWPGDARVDWVGIDAYRWPNAPDHPLTALIDGPLAGDFLSQAPSLGGGKPLLIGEVATSNRDPGSAGWIREAYRSLAHQPAVRAVCWFNRDQDGADWQFQPGSAATAAYRTAVSDQHFKGRSAVARP